MVYSSLWRKAKKGAWALIFIPSIAFADYGLGFFLKQKNDDYNLSINTNTSYDPVTGRIIGERFISETITKDISNLYFPYLSWRKGRLKVSLSDRYQALDYLWGFHGFKYGFGYKRFDYMEKLEITKQEAEANCVVACSYISKWGPMVKTKGVKTERKITTKPYLIIGYMFNSTNYRWNLQTNQEADLNFSLEFKLD